jgi:hypothetical protein
MMTFDDIRRYGTTGKLAVVTYGNGVTTALEARKILTESSVIASQDDIDVLDCPYLSGVPDGLREVVSHYDMILFADICKEGPGSSVLSSTMSSLWSEGLLKGDWEMVAAPRTYNPLGNTTTFLNADDVVLGCQKLLSRSK